MKRPGNCPASSFETKTVTQKADHPTFKTKGVPWWAFPLSVAAMTEGDNEPIVVSESGSESPVEEEESAGLTNGDLSLEALADKTLSDEEIPDIISREAITANGNVHRLYEQETDFNSVVFQNNDGTKSMYYFEDAVKYIKRL